ncbi:MFS transporter [Bordetella sp. FB-8]|uniref:MFS transporter n=1 Tax=Bordetella sp. FB-8 TaxID=1159870 RepID=UPI0003623867|nr:MFS transporter [Bordetella sp. FB-8]
MAAQYAPAPLAPASLADGAVGTMAGGRAPGAESGRKIEHGTAQFVLANVALFAAGLATFALLYCVQPLLPLFSQDFHISATQASLSLSLTTGLLAVSLLVAGPISEAWGRKPMMATSLLLSAVLALASAQLHSWGTFLAARALMGVAMSGLPAVAMAYVGEEMHPRTLGLAMGLYVGGSGLGGMSGRLLVGVMTDFWGWRTALTVMGLVGIACGAIFWRCLPDSRNFVRSPLSFKTLSRTYATHLRDGVLPWLFAEGLIVTGGFVTIYNYIGYRLVAPPFSLNQTEIGLIFVVYLFGIANSAFMGSLSTRFGRHRLLPFTFGLMLLGILLTCGGSLRMIVAGIAVLTVGFFGAHSMVSAWVGARAKVGKAQASSLYLFAYYMGSSVMGSLGGLFWTWGGWPGVAAMTGLLVAAGIAVAGMLGRLPALQPEKA